MGWVKGTGFIVGELRWVVGTYRDLGKMPQWIQEEGPHDQTIQTLEKEIDSHRTQHDRPESFICKNGALQEISLDEGKGQQGRKAVASRHHCR